MTAEHEPDLIISGEGVALGPLRRDLAATYARWVNHLDVRYGLDWLGIATPESEGAWVEETAKEAAEREPKSVGFTVYALSDREPIGTAILFSISHVHGRATLGIALGERRGQGFGTETTRLVIDWGFHTLGLQNIMLETMAWNGAAIRTYEKAGFKRIGVRRRSVMSRGELTDVVLMDAVRADFAASVIAAAAPTPMR